MGIKNTISEKYIYFFHSRNNAKGSQSDFYGNTKDWIIDAPETSEFGNGKVFDKGTKYIHVERQFVFRVSLNEINSSVKTTKDVATFMSSILSNDKVTGGDPVGGGNPRRPREGGAYI